MRQLNQEVDNQIEDYKWQVDDNKKTFYSTAPFSVDLKAQGDNSKAFDKLNEFRLSCWELRTKEENMKFGLDIFGIEP